jgi:hypothetical protein
MILPNPPLFAGGGTALGVCGIAAAGAAMGAGVTLTGCPHFTQNDPLIGAPQFPQNPAIGPPQDCKRVTALYPQHIVNQMKRATARPPFVKRFHNSSVCV